MNNKYMKAKVEYTYEELDVLFCTYLVLAEGTKLSNREQLKNVKSHWNTFIAALNNDPDAKSLRIMMTAVCDAEIKGMAEDEIRESDAIVKAHKLAEFLREIKMGL